MPSFNIFSIFIYLSFYTNIHLEFLCTTITQRTGKEKKNRDKG